MYLWVELNNKTEQNVTKPTKLNKTPKFLLLHNKTTKYFVPSQQNSKTAKQQNNKTTKYFALLLFCCFAVLLLANIIFCWFIDYPYQHRDQIHLAQIDILYIALINILLSLVLILIFDISGQKQAHNITSLKAFSHQRRAKPFNTLRSKADLFEKSPFLTKKPFLAKKPLQIWQKYYRKKSSFCRKAITAKNTFLAKCLIKFDPFLADLIQENQTVISIYSVNVTTFNRNIFWLVRNPISSSLIKFDQVWTGLI